MNIKNLIVSAVTIATTISREINDNDEIKMLLCGQYSDGRPRSISDAVSGEYRSPKQKRKEDGSKKKKKHKKDKYKKKYKKLKKKNKKNNKRKKNYAKKYKYTI